MTHCLRPSAVLFDFDGTLVDTEKFWFGLKESFLSSLGVADGRAIAEQFSGVALRIFAESILDSGVVTDLKPDEIVGAIDHLAFAENGPAPALMTGASDLLLRLYQNGVTLAVCSNAPHMWINDCLVTHGLGGYFSGIFSRAGSSLGKPHPQVYLDALESLNIDVSTAIAVEDSDSGVKAAISAGLPVILVGENAAGRRKFMPSAVCRSLADITDDMLGAAATRPHGYRQLAS